MLKTRTNRLEQNKEEIRTVQQTSQTRSSRLPSKWVSAQSREPTTARFRQIPPDSAGTVLPRNRVRRFTHSRTRTTRSFERETPPTGSTRSQRISREKDPFVVSPNGRNACTSRGAFHAAALSKSNAAPFSFHRYKQGVRRSSRRFDDSPPFRARLRVSAPASSIFSPMLYTAIAKPISPSLRADRYVDLVRLFLLESVDRKNRSFPETR